MLRCLLAILMILPFCSWSQEEGIDPKKLDSLARTIDASRKEMKNWQDSFVQRQDSLYRSRVSLKEKGADTREGVQERDPLITIAYVVLGIGSLAVLLEVSSDARRYQMAGIPAADIRSFNTLPAKEGMLQYRLKVSFDNGQHYYSNIVTLSNQSDSRPALVSNMIQHSATVKSPVSAAYTISDYNGRMIAKGFLTTGMNQINTSSLVNGMYIIRYEHEQELYTEKFMKQ